MPEEKNSNTRRSFLMNTARTTAGAMVLANIPQIVKAGFPTIVPSSVFGKNAPSNKINVAQIGCGRIARTHDLAETFKYDVARIMAIADVDRNRLQDGKKTGRRLVCKKNGQG